MIKPKDENGYYLFYCPGCKCNHAVTDSWSVNTKEATISPSVLVRSSNENGPTRCHSFVKNGHIQYLNDCTHEFAGKTIKMEEEAL